MKITFIRVLTTIGTVLFVALSGWTTVGAAKLTGRYIANHLIPDAATDTPTATVTPTMPPTMTETPVLNGTHEPGDDDHDEYLTTVPTGTPYMEEDDDQDEDDAMVVPGMTATPFVGKEDDEDHKSGSSVSSTPGSYHNDDDEHSGEGGDD